MEWSAGRIVKTVSLILFLVAATVFFDQIGDWHTDRAKVRPCSFPYSGASRLGVETVRGNDPGGRHCTWR